MFCSISEAALGVGKNFAIELLHMDSVSDVAVATAFVTVGYVIQYALIGGTHQSKGFQFSHFGTKRKGKKVKTSEIGNQFGYKIVDVDGCFVNLLVTYLLSPF